MIYKYIRFSTEKQDEKSQENIIDTYLAAKGMTADKTYKDEGVSGGKSYKQRNLGVLCETLQKGDTVVVSEVSRLTRSGIGELCEIVEKHFKPAGLRLIICNVGLDIDCTRIDPITEMQLYMFATFAKIEKSLIQERTQSALDNIKRDIKEKGFHVTKDGKTITKLGSGSKPTRKAHDAAGDAVSKKAGENPNNRNFENYIAIFEERHGSMAECTIGAIWDKLVEELNRLGYKTARGLEFDQIRARSMYKNLIQHKANKQKREKEIQQCGI